jgi:phosphatidylserine decarboxylase
MKLHKEGYKIILVIFLLLAAINTGIYLLVSGQLIIMTVLIVSSLMFFGFVVYFFRDPQINIDANDKLVLAPADGKVVVVEDTDEDEYFKDKRLQVSIFMSPLNAHINRTPVAGKVNYYQYHEGKYLVAWHPKSSKENERTTTVLEHKNGIEVLVRQIAGAVARRICNYTELNKPIAQGAEFGFIKFGSRVDVFLPVNADVKVEIGQKAKAGRTVLAELPD